MCEMNANDEVDEVEKTNIIQGTLSGKRQSGRSTPSWRDININWTGLALNEAVEGSKSRSQRRKVVRDEANPRNRNSEHETQCVAVKTRPAPAPAGGGGRGRGWPP